MTQSLHAKSMSMEDARVWLDAVLVKYTTLDIDEMLSCFAPDIVVNYGTLPQISGIAALREFLAERYGAVTDFNVAKTVRCVTDGVVGLEATVSYTNSSGKKIQGIAFEFLTVDDEGLISVWDNISIVWEVV